MGTFVIILTCLILSHGITVVQSGSENDKMSDRESKKGLDLRAKRKSEFKNELGKFEGESEKEKVSARKGRGVKDAAAEKEDFGEKKPESKSSEKDDKEKPGKDEDKEKGKTEDNTDTKKETEGKAEGEGNPEEPDSKADDAKSPKDEEDKAKKDSAGEKGSDKEAGKADDKESGEAAESEKAGKSDAGKAGHAAAPVQKHAPQKPRKPGKVSTDIDKMIEEEASRVRGEELELTESERNPDMAKEDDARLTPEEVAAKTKKKAEEKAKRAKASKEAAAKEAADAKTTLSPEEAQNNADMEKEVMEQSARQRGKEIEETEEDEEKNGEPAVDVSKMEKKVEKDMDKKGNDDKSEPGKEEEKTEKKEDEEKSDSDQNESGKAGDKSEEEKKNSDKDEKDEKSKSDENDKDKSGDKPKEDKASSKDDEKPNPGKSESSTRDDESNSDRNEQEEGVGESEKEDAFSKDIEKGYSGKIESGKDEQKAKTFQSDQGTDRDESVMENEFIEEGERAKREEKAPADKTHKEKPGEKKPKAAEAVDAKKKVSKEHNPKTATPETAAGETRAETSAENDLVISTESRSVSQCITNDLPQELRDKIQETNDAEDMVLSSYVKSENVPFKVIHGYRTAKEAERTFLKDLLPELGPEADDVLATYRALRKGVAWNYVVHDEKYKEFFRKNSTALTLYQTLKADESSTLDSFLTSETQPQTVNDSQHANASEVQRVDLTKRSFAGDSADAAGASAKQKRSGEVLHRGISATGFDSMDDSEVMDRGKGRHDTREKTVQVPQDDENSSEEATTKFTDKQTINFKSNLVKCLILFSVIAQMIVVFILVIACRMQVVKWNEKHKTIHHEKNTDPSHVYSRIEDDETLDVREESANFYISVTTVGPPDHHHP